MFLLLRVLSPELIMRSMADIQCWRITARYSAFSRIAQRFNLENYGEYYAPYCNCWSRGLQLGLGLLDTGYDVTMIELPMKSVKVKSCQASVCCFTNWTWLGTKFLGRTMSEGIGLALVNPENGGKAFELVLNATLNRSINASKCHRRIWTPWWPIDNSGCRYREQLASDYELVLLAAGKGENSLSVMMHVAFLISHSALDLCQKHEANFTILSCDFIPEVGEYFSFPALTVNGPSWCLKVFQMGQWIAGKMSWTASAMQFGFTQEICALERCANVELTDAGGYLAGRRQYVNPF